MTYPQMLRRFQMPGVTKTLNNVRSTFEWALLDRMRVEGYVPVLDLEPYYSTEYNLDKDEYNVLFVLQGVYVGIKEAKKSKGLIYGMDLQQYTESLLPGALSKDWD